MSGTPRVSASRPSLTRRIRRLGAATLALALAAPLLVSVPGGADEIDDKRAEAATVADEVEQLQVEAERLAEQYNEARIAQQDLASDLETVRESVAEARRKLKERRSELSSYAVEAYVRGGNTSELADVIGAEANESSARSGYTQAAVGDRADLVDRLNGAEQLVQSRVSELDRAEEAAAEKRDEVEDARQDAEDAVAAEQSVLDDVKGELADLVAAEQARRAAEEAARAERAAREAAAARQTAAPPAAPDEAADDTDGASAAPAPSTTSPSTTSPSTTSPSTTSPSTTSPSTTSPSTTSPSTTSPAPAPAPEPAPEPAPAPAPAPAPDPAPAPAPSGGASGAQAAIAAARSQMGNPYLWGGASPSTGFDCSGFTMWSWAQAGKSLPHSSSMQYSQSRRIPLGQIQPGDLVFYGSPIQHVALYIGGGQIIHSPNSRSSVRIDSMYYWSSLVGAGRI